MAQNLKINILAQDKTKQAFNGIRGRLAGLKDAVLSVKGALVGIGAGLNLNWRVWILPLFNAPPKSLLRLKEEVKQEFPSGLVSII